MVTIILSEGANNQEVGVGVGCFCVLLFGALWSEKTTEIAYLQSYFKDDFAGRVFGLAKPETEAVVEFICIKLDPVQRERQNGHNAVVTLTCTQLRILSRQGSLTKFHLAECFSAYIGNLYLKSSTRWCLCATEPENDSVVGSDPFHLYFLRS